MVVAGREASLGPASASEVHAVVVGRLRLLGKQGAHARVFGDAGVGLPLQGHDPERLGQPESARRHEAPLVSTRFDTSRRGSQRQEFTSVFSIGRTVRDVKGLGSPDQDTHQGVVGPYSDEITSEQSRPGQLVAPLPCGRQ